MPRLGRWLKTHTYTLFMDVHGQESMDQEFLITSSFEFLLYLVIFCLFVADQNLFDIVPPLQLENSCLGAALEHTFLDVNFDLKFQPSSLTCYPKWWLFAGADFDNDPINHH